MLIERINIAVNTGEIHVDDVLTVNMGRTPSPSCAVNNGPPDIRCSTNPANPCSRWWTRTSWPLGSAEQRDGAEQEVAFLFRLQDAAGSYPTGGLTRE